MDFGRGKLSKELGFDTSPTTERNHWWQTDWESLWHMAKEKTRPPVRREGKKEQALE